MTKTLRYGSVCSGIEAASVAWKSLGWQAAWFSEIDPFPRDVLAHHYPEVVNLGDMTKVRELLQGSDTAPDVLCGGTPCQAFSLAGLRKGLEDHRGQLTLEFCKIADEIDRIRKHEGKDPCIVFWENVPGVLSSKDNAFGCFLAGLAGATDPFEPPGKKWKECGVVLGTQRLAVWRILDAQFFGLAQRRRRVFVLSVALEHPRAWAIAEALLPLCQGGSRNPPTRSETRESIIRDVAPSLGASGRGVARKGESRGQDPVVAVFGGNNTGGAIPVAPALNANRGCHNPGDFEAGALVVGPLGAHGQEHGFPGSDGACSGHVVPVCVTGDRTHALKAEGADGSEDGTGRGTPIVAFHPLQDPISSEDGSTHALGCGSSSHGECSIAVLEIRGREGESNLEMRTDGLANCLRGSNGGRAGMGVGAVHYNMQVRRLTPTECERLMGFPDGYTANILNRPVPASGQSKARQRMEAGDTMFTEINGVIWKVHHADGPRYKALGNSWAVPIIQHLGRRIQQALSPSLTNV